MFAPATIVSSWTRTHPDLLMSRPHPPPLSSPRTGSFHLRRNEEVIFLISSRDAGCARMYAIGHGKNQSMCSMLRGSTSRAGRHLGFTAGRVVRFCRSTGYPVSCRGLALTPCVVMIDATSGVFVTTLSQLSGSFLHTASCCTSSAVPTFQICSISWSKDRSL